MNVASTLMQCRLTFIQRRIKVVLKSEVDLKKTTTFFLMFYLKVGAMANKKMIKKVRSLCKILLQRPKKRAGHMHKFRLFYYMKKIKFSFN